MTVARGDQRRSVPSAIVHKRILEEADARPEASLEELAAAVSGATISLVERVLDDYGDPAEEPASTLHGSTPETTPNSPAATWADFTDKQREVLRLIYEDPTASQRDLADRLGVSHTAVYHRLKSIAGFEWADRWTFVSTVLDDERSAAETNGGFEIDRAPDPDGRPDQRSLARSPRLAGKVIRACHEADGIGDEEFRLVLDALLPRTGDGPE